MNHKNYYDILGVAPTATYLEIKSAYRRLAKQHHPDKNPGGGAESHARFADIAEAYRTLSSLQKRRAYDASRQEIPEPQKAGPFRFTQPHYSGYPYFQYDIFTPFIHSFFVGRPGPRAERKPLQTLILNYRTLAVALAGALVFFKFFSVMNGTVQSKDIATGFFTTTSYVLILKTDNDKTKKKRVKLELYDKVELGDIISKSRFSFTYKVNGEDVSFVTLPRFIIHTMLIYGVITLGLLFLERSRV